jgi:hypothetical protein
MVTAIWAAFLAYGIPEWANWGVATAACESELHPGAWDGYYTGLFQHDPNYYPARAAAAGLPGSSPWNPVDNAMTTAWMIKAGYGWQHWPVCGANSWRPA